MSAQILDGRALAKTVRGEVAEKVAALRAAGTVPGLAVVLVGEDPASTIYVRNKAKAAAEVGVEAFDHKLPSSTTQDQLMGLVRELNQDSRVHGILVQLPLPKGLDAEEVLDSIDPKKDVDGFHPENIGRLAQGRPRYVAATPKGCMRLIAESNIELSGAHAVIVGRSNIVGKPMAMLLTNANATVSLCHSRTKDLAAEVKRADVLVAAVGRAKMIPGSWLKPGATVIDVGINRGDDKKLCGDVDFASAEKVAGAITPVPGGVGPMTIASLLANTALAAS